MPKTPTDDNSNKPWVDNYPPLKKWLEKIDAECVQQIPVGDQVPPIAYIERWTTQDRREFLITVHANRHGWNIYTPLADSNAVDATLLDAEERLKLL